jgi:UDP-N-acetylglucosamine--dolichyl-phosphate N-acetylglucosaminephosphotransferase
MVDALITVCFFVAFLTTFMLLPKWIRKAEVMGLTGRDMNKPKRPEVAEAGGVTIIAGTAAGILAYVFLYTFYFNSEFGLIEIFASLTTILLAGIIGFVDDILGWKSGISHSTKVALTVPIAIPMAVVNAGHSQMLIPLIGSVDFGLLFPLILVPAGIIGAINGYNMLAGYNGLEAGMGIIILTALALIAWGSGTGWVSMLSLIMVSSLAAFFIFNKMPARVFPGDSLTYAVGAMVASVAILGNMEKFALALFLPYFFDAAMFMRFRFVDRTEKIEAFAKVNADGSLGMPHSKIYDFTHLLIRVIGKVKKRVYEKDVVLASFLIEIVLAAMVITWWFLFESQLL